MAILFSCLSCKKTTNEEAKVKVQTTLFTVTLTDNFIPDQYKAIIFISGPDGKPLADTTCIANGTYNLCLKNGVVMPAWVMVTIVNYETVMHELKIHMNTYTHVTPQSNWTIKGLKPDSTGHIVLSLVNIPLPKGEIIYSTSGFYNITFNPDLRTSMLYKSTDDLYVKVNYTTGDRFKIVSGVLPNGNYNIDMADASLTGSQSISFPFPVQNYEADIYGYKEQNFDSPIPTLTDMVISDGKTVSNIKVAYPPSFFTGFHTQLMIQETYTSDVLYYYHTDGDIPGTFKKTDASIVSMQPEKGSVKIQSTGTFDMITAHWEYVSPALEFYDWQIYGPDTTQTVTLPAIAPAFSRLFNSLAIDSLNLVYTELTDFQTLASYNEFLQKVFDPSHPQIPDRFESSSVKRNYSQKSLFSPQRRRGAEK
jgi:hypothetical protein